jgi:hypothetical protein
MENNEVTKLSKAEFEAKLKELLASDLSEFEVIEQKPDLLASKSYDVRNFD